MNQPVPQYDTTAFLDEFRTAQISHLLVAAVTDFDVGAALVGRPLSFDQLRDKLGLNERPAIVLLTALRSIELIEVNEDGTLQLTPYGKEKMDPASPFHLRGYLGLGGFSADVQNMITCLRNDQPNGDVSFVFHQDGPASALDDAEIANLLTRAMADRAHNIAPLLAERIDLATAKSIVDVGGAHGLYSLELLKKNPELNAIVIDRAPPLKVAKEYATEAGLAERVQLVCDDAHTATLDEPADVVLLANLLHDYNADDAGKMVKHYATQLASGGRLLVLDSLLNSVADGAPPVSDGPRPVAAYSALLFSICEGRCYRRDEVDQWMVAAGLRVDDEVVSLPAHGSVITGWKC